jgi:hypothetical protein
MAIDTETRASRRNILAAALGGLGGLLVGRLGTPDSARAADDGNAILGQANTSTTETSFENTENDETSLKGSHNLAGKGVEATVGGTGYGLYATASASGGRAVFASSVDKAGVTGHSTTTTPDHAPDPGENVGVVGIAGNAGGIAPDMSETGVYGFCDTSFLYAAGVWGDSAQGIGVVGSGDWGVIASGGSVGLVATGPTALKRAASSSLAAAAVATTCGRVATTWTSISAA